MRIFNKKLSSKDFLPPIFNRCLYYIWNKFTQRQIGEVKLPYTPICYRQLVQSYSQYHEDLLLDALLSPKNFGYYIDIGANDPIEINNTKRFYDRGWTGINIEPDPVLFKRLCDGRPNDINLNMGISDRNEAAFFYRMSSHVLSSFDKRVAMQLGKRLNSHLLSTIEVQVCSLESVLNKYWSEDKPIDFMSVDAEGLELRILRGNNWQKYRPQLLVIEINNNTQSIVEYLENQEYKLTCQNSVNGIFLNARHL